MTYGTLLAVGAITLAAITTPTFGNGVPTLVDTCGVESSNAGETILVTADIVDTYDEHNPILDCILITHDDVTLDCQGYRLTQVGIGRARAVRAEGDRVTVQNCEVRGWLNGVFYRLTGDGVILNNKLVANKWGIGLIQSNGAWVEGNKVDATENGGIQILRSSSNWIYDNTVHGSGFAGILLNDPWSGGGSDGNFVIDNQVNLNGLHGILLADDSGGNTVFGNTANLNEGIGIAVRGISEGNVIEKNTANRNDIGILSDGLNGFYGNRCHKNTKADSDPDGLCK